MNNKEKEGLSCKIEPKATRRGFFYWFCGSLFVLFNIGAISGIVCCLLKSLMPSNWTPRSYIYRKIYATSLKDINVIGKAILFQDKANHRKAILVNNDGVIQAFSLVCSHLGCQVSWDKENREFFCPCHRGKFFSDGRVKSGPPPKGLDEYNVNIEGDMVFIEFKEPYWQPEQYFKGGYKL